MKKKIIFTAVIFVAVLALIAVAWVASRDSQQPIVVQDDWSTFTTSDSTKNMFGYGFTFDHPSDWTIGWLEPAKLGLQSPETIEGLDGGGVFPGYSYDLTIERVSSLNSYLRIPNGSTSCFSEDLTDMNLATFLELPDLEQCALLEVQSTMTLDSKDAYLVSIGGYGVNDGVMLQDGDSIYILSFERTAQRLFSDEDQQILDSFHTF